MLIIYLYNHDYEYWDEGNDKLNNVPWSYTIIQMI